MSEWISVKERLPESGIPVLVAYLGYRTGEQRCDGVAVVDNNGVWGWWDGGNAEETVIVEITHWMPLPEPPKEGEIRGENNHCND